MCVVQGTTSIMFRVLNSNSTSSFNSIDKHKFIYFLQVRILIILII